MGKVADEYKIGRLQVRPGDILVVKINGRASKAVIDRVSEAFRQKLPNVEALVIDDDIDLSILSCGDGLFAC